MTDWNDALESEKQVAFEKGLDEILALFRKQLLIHKKLGERYEDAYSTLSLKRERTWNDIIQLNEYAHELTQSDYLVTGLMRQITMSVNTALTYACTYEMYGVREDENVGALTPAMWLNKMAKSWNVTDPMPERLSLESVVLESFGTDVETQIQQIQSELDAKIVNGDYFDMDPFSGT